MSNQDRYSGLTKDNPSSIIFAFARKWYTLKIIECSVSLKVAWCLISVKQTLLLSVSHLFINSPYCLPYKSLDVGSENLVLDQPIFPKLICFFVPIIFSYGIMLILYGDFLS